MRIVFLGTGEIGVPSLKALAELSSHEVCAVFTQPDRPAGRDLKLRASAIKQTAIALGIPVFQPEKIREAEPLAELQGLRPDIIVVVAYGQILPRRILDLPPLGCLNIHASLLPLHRGASPINAAILAGDKESGLTIMQMDVGLDTGDMLFKVATPIAPEDTAGSLHDRLAQMAPAALLHTLDLISRGMTAPEKQDDSFATYAPKLSRKDGEIDWKKSAIEIDRQIRGLTPWPGAYTTVPEAKPLLLKVHRAVPRAAQGGGLAGSVLETNESGILVGAGEGAMLLQEVQAAGGKKLPAGAFLRGRALPVGTVLG